MGNGDRGRENESEGLENHVKCYLPRANKYPESASAIYAGSDTAANSVRAGPSSMAPDIDCQG
jgi:hypothetical protein